MDRLLARLERRFGRFAIPNLIAYVVGGMALVWALAFVRPYVVERMMLDMDAVRRGEVWRLFTFLFIPSTTSPIWILLNLYFTWWVGSSLEQHWGAFKFNVYYLVGVLGTICAAVVAGPQSNTYLDWSLLLAFAALFPESTVLLFIVPVRVKWLGLALAVYLAYLGMKGDWSTRAAILAAVGNYFLFFSGHWWDRWKGRSLAVRQKARREQSRPSGTSFGQRECAICGAREADGVDIRVCSCEKCGGQSRALCLEHARNH
jgi:hypothetical protein